MGGSVATSKKCFINLVLCLISPTFKRICLNSGEKASQLILLCLAFNSFTLTVLYAADLVLELFHHRSFVYAIIDRQDHTGALENLFSKW